MAEQCYSNPSSLVRLAKKLKFSGWLELVYFIKFNITMPKLDVTNDIDYMSVQPEAEGRTWRKAAWSKRRSSICFVRIETNLSDCSINFFNVL